MGQKYNRHSECQPGRKKEMKMESAGDWLSIFEIDSR